MLGDRVPFTGFSQEWFWPISICNELWNLLSFEPLRKISSLQYFFLWNLLLRHLSPKRHRFEHSIETTLFQQSDDSPHGSSSSPSFYTGFYWNKKVDNFIKKNKTLPLMVDTRIPFFVILFPLLSAPFYTSTHFPLFFWTLEFRPLGVARRQFQLM